MPPTENSPTKAIRYLSLEQILAIHSRLINRYGGSKDIFNHRLLESAVFRPQATAFGREAYSTLFEKCAVLGYSLIQNHPFIDGNKRTGFAAIHLMLLINGYDLCSTTEEEITMAEKVASGKMSQSELARWLKQNSRKKS